MPVLNPVKPDICVKCSPNHSADVLRTILLGMEEEGIPFHLAEEAQIDAMALAWEASEESRLDVGVGVDDKNVVLGFAKLKADKPLFVVPVSAGNEKVRDLGANAARLVKRMPFKM
ncbi:glycerol dehydratase reactivase beta/small subunit family protein [Paratractidigestivibacter sp.]|nr:glycerol dehydratase reactivase beta/small subunit family protein [Paratractidigestivibacter sp.]